MTSNERRRVLHASLATLAGACLPVERARGSERLRIVCASPPGGPPDLVARAYADAVASEHGTPVIVDNRPGAGGLVAIAAFKQAAGDPGTLLLAHGSLFTTFPVLYARLPYDPQADFALLSMAAEFTLALAVGPVVPSDVRTLDGYLAWGRAHPEACNHGTPGIGTMPHLLAELLYRDARVSSQHVPYGSGPQAINDLLGGRLAAVVLPEGILRAQRPGGRLRILAGSGDARSRFLPDVPTFAELGMPRLVCREWLAFVMPSQAPAAPRERVAAMLRQAAQVPTLVGALDVQAMQPPAPGAVPIADRIAADQRLWQQPVRQLGIRLE